MKRLFCRLFGHWWAFVTPTHFDHCAVCDTCRRCGTYHA